MNISLRLATVLLLLQAGSTLGENSVELPLKAADQLLAHGSVEAARRQYEGLHRAAPDNPAILERLGYICHLTGQYREAVRWFDKAIAANPERRIRLLAYSAYAHYQLKDYVRALKVLTEVESTGYRYQTAFFAAKQLQQLAETPPYQIDDRVDRTVVAFELLDPLPVIHVRINSRTVHAFIDTGGPQFVVDPTLAEEEHVTPLSEQVSRGIGGRAGQKVGFGMVGSVALGDIEMRNVPVMFLPVRRVSKLFGVQIDAVLGTETLAQFLPTLDFPGKRLILRTKTKTNREEIRAMPVKTTLPFIMDDMHSMYAQCHVNDKQPVLLYFDTGLVDDHGASILTSRDQLLDLGVPISGDSKSGYADIPRVRVGSLERTNVKALYGSGTQVTYCEYLKPYGLIGHNFLKHYQWTIDFENRLFLFAY